MPTNDSIAHITIEVDTVLPVDQVVPTSQMVVMKDTIINHIEVIGNAPSVFNIDDTISPILIIAMLGIGVGLFFALAFLKKYILPVVAQRTAFKNANLFWYRTTVILWLSFGLIWLYILLKSSLIITLICLIVVGILFFHFIVDFVLGMYFRFENQIKINDLFKLDDIEGEVDEFTARQLKITSDKGEEIYLPYRNLLRAPFRIVKVVDSLIENEFTVTLEGDSAMNLNQLHKYMTMCPWIHDANLYTILHIDGNQYSITVRVKEALTAKKIESFILSKI